MISLKKSKVVEAKGLTKKYGNFVAVNNIDFHVLEGECFGFLGPNGAGKTTTVKMIYCFSPVTSGTLKVMGMDVRQHQRDIKARLGVVPQENNLDLELTVRQNLLIYAGYFDIVGAEAEKRADELLEFFGLTDKKNTPVNNLSGGMKRRLTIARALINKPGLLILDEPTTGLDPQARHLVWQQLRELKNKGITLLLTTHYLEEADRLCDRLIIMDKGKILDQGDPRALVKKHAGDEVLELSVPEDQRKCLLKRVQKDICGHLNLGSNLYLFPKNGKMLLARLQNENFTLRYQLLRPANLEDVFFKLTGRGLG